ncbi:MAG: FxsA family protein [Rhodomicrobium sp.]
MPFLVFFFIISLPVLEVASIVQVSRWVGPTATFLLLAASVAFGAFLIRTQSLRVGRRAMEAMRAGSPPEQTLLDSGSIMLAGVLFMIPGFFSDVLALFLLLPAARRLMWRGASFGLRRRTRTWRPETRPGAQAQKPHRAGDVIDVEFTEVPRDRKSSGENGAHRDSPWSKS